MKTRFSTLILFALFAATTALGDPVGSVEFTVRTKPITGKYAPRHVIAIWVTNSNGDFIKTLAVHGGKQKKRLKTWAQQSKKNEVDAVTGATLKAYQAHTVTWNCRDAKGNPVPDGEDQIHVEYTSSNKQGPVTPSSHIQFRKGSKAVVLAPKKLNHFDLIKLNYTPCDRSDEDIKRKKKT